MRLLVTEPFADHAKGDFITDEAEIADILGTLEEPGPQAAHVVKVADAPEQADAQADAQPE